MARPGCQAQLAGNQACLRQGLTVVERLTSEQFVHLPAPFAPRDGGSRPGVGAHLRHILDHYDSFLEGWEQGRIDYDRRERDRALECDRGLAVRKIRQVLERLEQLDLRTDRELLVAQDPATAAATSADAPGASAERAGPVSSEGRWARSSAARELQFLASHTVHHYAIIAILLRLMGLEPGTDFGVAPSTLRFEREHSACAR